MRSLYSMRIADARATVDEAEEIQSERNLTVTEAAELASALQILQEHEGDSPEKSQRRAAWLRKKARNRRLELVRAELRKVEAALAEDED